MCAKFNFVTLLIFFAGFRLVAEIQAQTETNIAVSPSHVASYQCVNGGEIITREGKPYKNVVLQRVEPDGLVIRYSAPGDGLAIAKLNFKDLSDGLQQQFGYNSTNAATFEIEEIQAERERQAKWVADERKAESKLIEDQIVETERQSKAVGTGFFVTDNGYLLTCFHVVNKATNISVGTTKGVFPAELIQTDPTEDLALLKVAGSFAALPLVSDDGVDLGESVMVQRECHFWVSELSN